jgi:hypothetical protein
MSKLQSPPLEERAGERRSHAEKPLPPLSAIAFVPLSPTLSPRFAGGAREKLPVAVSGGTQQILGDKTTLDTHPAVR